mgnify:CR=1 FL=1|tara:strand:- start:36 stop:203 length:168 start_codon:yes stop_codon:yes gene_type:complete
MRGKRKRLKELICPKCNTEPRCITFSGRRAFYMCDECKGKFYSSVGNIFYWEEEE